MARGLPRTLGRAAARTAGTAAGTGVKAVETGIGGSHQTTLRFTNLTIAAVDTAAVVARAVQKIYDFPEGHIQIRGVTANLALTKSSLGISDTWNGDFALGSVAAAGDATLTGTESDILPSTATPAAVAGATTAKGRNAAAIAPFDGTTTALDLYLNILIDDADQDVTTTPANVIVNGEITFFWDDLGDF